MAVAESPRRWIPSEAVAVTSNSGRRNSSTRKPWTVCMPSRPALPPVPVRRTAAWPRFMVPGRVSMKSKPPRGLNFACPLESSLPRESVRVQSMVRAASPRAPTSPLGPEPTRRAQPFRCTVSPGR